MQVVQDPVVLREDLHQVKFHLLRIGLPGQPQFPRNAADVCIHHDARISVNIAPDHVGGLAADPGQGAFVETIDGYGTAVQVNLLRQTVKVKLDSDTDDSLHLYKANELCAVPGGRPKDGEEPPHVLHYVPEEPEEEELAEPSGWEMPTLVVPEVKEDARSADKPAREEKSRRSRRRRGGEKSGAKKEAGSAEKKAAPEKTGGENEKKPARGEKGKKATVKPVKLTVKGESAAAAKHGGESAETKTKRSARPNRRRRSRGKEKSGAAE